MEESTMYNPNNLFPDETIGAQPAETYPPMEKLPPKSTSPQYPIQNPPTSEGTAQPEPLEVAESPVTRQEEALTIKFAIGKLNDYLLWFLTVLEVTLLLRFLLKLIGADPTNLFAGFLYALTDILLFPFNGIVKSPSIHPPNQSFEFSTLIAMTVYFLVFYALRRFLRILISGPEEPVE
jgi:uncharacterized protein YggT (Ycf19 family)